MSDPAISVIVPIYNVSKFLKQCLESLRAQTFKNFEAIMVNDGSTDSSPEIAEYFARIDDRFTLIHQENGGLGSARNTGTRHAKGEYIKHVDSDDWFDKSMLHALYSRAKRYDADIVLGTYIESLNDDTKLNIVNLPQSLHYAGKMFNWRDNREVFITPTPVWDKLYRRRMLERNNITFIRENCEDIPYRWQTLLSSHKITVLSTPYYYYRVREGSLTTKSQLGNDLAFALAKAEQYLIANGKRSLLDPEWSFRKLIETIYIAIKARRSLLIDNDFATTYYSRLREVCASIDIQNLGRYASYLPSNYVVLYFLARENCELPAFLNFLDEQEFRSAYEDLDDYTAESKRFVGGATKTQFSLKGYVGEKFTPGFVEQDNIILIPTVHSGHPEPCMATTYANVEEDDTALFAYLHAFQPERNCDVAVCFKVTNQLNGFSKYVKRVMRLGTNYASIRMPLPKGRYRVEMLVEGDQKVSRRIFTGVAVSNLMLLGTKGTHSPKALQSRSPVLAAAD